MLVAQVYFAPCGVTVPNGGQPAFRWIAETGTQSLGIPAGTWNSWAHSMSGDGQVVGGGFDGPSGFGACLWTPSLGMVDLNLFLPSIGVDLAGWTLGEALAISRDGTAIAGSGFFAGSGYTWLVTGLPFAPPPCKPDCDASGSLDIDDFICFQTRFAISDPYADCDASGALNISDFICFQALFAVGC